ncbi:RNA dependent RNA polymerase-domain-containing protein [Aspergillus falconensis]
MPPPKSRPIPVPQTVRQQLIIAPWRNWESVAVYLTNVTAEVSTLDLWRAFKDEGSIRSIDIFEDSHGNRTTKAKIRFRPPPDTNFWKTVSRRITLRSGASISISMSLDNKPLDWEIPSPVRKGVTLPAEFKVSISSMDIGVLVDESTMMPMRTVGSLTAGSASLVLDLRYKNLLVYFELRILSIARPQNYRLKIPFSQLDRFFQTKNPSTNDISHFIFLGSPPEYHRRIQNTENSFGNKETSWREWDTWYRQANIVHNPTELAHLPVGLRRLNPIIDIGRWNAFRINYPENCDDGGRFRLFCSILSDYNIIVEETDCFKLHDTTKGRPTPIWKWIDLEPKASGTSSTFLQDLLDTSHVHLPFSVRYMLEVCISHGYLSEFNMTREFALKLAGLEEVQARKLLEHVTLQKKTYYNPMEIFDTKFIRGATLGKMPSYCCLVRSARVTPSTVYYNVPSVDISNRVIRHYINLADNFLRVRFTDEKHIGRIYATADHTMDEVLTRIKRALANGITIGSTQYEFLAFGNSQFREHGAYFFAPKDGVTAASIRAWMGQFSHIRSIAKHAARLGQCFSTTRAISGCTAHVNKIDDIERNGYNFSDGVGRISKFLAQIAASELKIKTPTKEPPSAYQFRLGGCKGMLVVSPEAQRQEVHIRKSQFKFAAFSQGLEIIRWSQFTVATLNRQLILVLSTLGVTDDIFHLKLKTMLRNLDEAMESDPKAVYLLRKYVDPNQVTLTVSQMILDGFRRSNEPFVSSILTLWRSWHLKYLKEKAKIVIDKGACVLGCMDETATLKGYFFDHIPKKDAPLEEKIAALPEIFLQVYLPEDGGRYEIIEGLCILARNPSLHPGDIRVVRAVNAPGLHHLKDVVVLPQTGDRDVASMCSGGDLDGDDYLVIWDQDLLPDDWFREPFHYDSEKAYELDHDVTVDEITSFFVTYIKNDCLPRIAHAHLAWGDYLDDGLNEAKCIRLAQLHSNAVDYNKTGNPAVMTQDLNPRKWPHFMKKNNKPESARYRSKKVLGQLYDAVETIDFVPNLEMDFDERILNCLVEVPGDIYGFARELKDEYDIAIRRIMAQHEIKTEFEVWSTFVLSHAKIDKDYKFHEDIGAMSFALRENFKKRAFDKVGGRTFDVLAPLAVAMYRVTHKEMAAALARHREENPPDERLFNDKPAPKMEQLPLISFPWMFSKILGQIAMGNYEHPDTASTLSTDLYLNGPVQHQIEEAELDAYFKEVDAAKQNPQALGSSRNQPDDDPFGLGPRDEADAATIVNNNMPSSDCNAKSLEELLDFGPLNAPGTSSGSLALASPLVKEGTLLDFDRDPVEGGWEASPKKTALDLVENQSMHVANNKQNGFFLSPLIVDAAPILKESKSMNERNGRQTRVIEIVEESDGDDDPVGLGKLNELVAL